jgi:hypothetical protein
MNFKNMHRGIDTNKLLLELDVVEKEYGGLNSNNKFNSGVIPKI